MIQLTSIPSQETFYSVACFHTFDAGSDKIRPFWPLNASPQLMDDLVVNNRLNPLNCPVAEFDSLDAKT